MATLAIVRDKVARVLGQTRIWPHAQSDFVNRLKADSVAIRNFQTLTLF